MGCLQTSVYADCLPNSLTSASITDRLQSPGHILILTLRKVRETKRIRFGKIGICKMGVYTSAVTHGDIVWDLKDPTHNLTAFLYTVTFKEIEYPPLEPKKNPQRIRCPRSRGKQNVHIYFKTEIYNFNWLNELKYDKSITNKII